MFATLKRDRQVRRFHMGDCKGHRRAIVQRSNVNPDKVFERKRRKANSATRTAWTAASHVTPAHYAA
jgi:hypothetical protein